MIAVADPAYAWILVLGAGLAGIAWGAVLEWRR